MPNIGSYRDGHEFNSPIGNYARDLFDLTKHKGFPFKRGWFVKTPAEIEHDRQVNEWQRTRRFDENHYRSMMEIKRSNYTKK